LWIAIELPIRVVYFESDHMISLRGYFRINHNNGNSKLVVHYSTRLGRVGRNISDKLCLRHLWASSITVAFHYDRAPITDALIDLRVEVPAGVTLDVLESLHNQYKDTYPQRKKGTFVEARFLTGEEIGAATKQKEIGYSFQSTDGRQIVQARLDGFTFSRL